MAAFLCPTCKVALKKARLSESGCRYGCAQCGGWFTASQLGPEAAETVSRRRRLPAAPPGGRLTKTSVAMRLEASHLSGAVRELVPRALQGAGQVFHRGAELAEMLVALLADGRGLELRRDVALLSMRVDGLAGPRAALGLAPEGLDCGALSADRVHVVALFLKPGREGSQNLPSWAKRGLSDEKTVYELRKAQSVEEVLKALQAD